MTMKKEYVNPKTTVVLLQERHHMLQASLQMNMKMSGYQQGGTTPSIGSDEDEGDGDGDGDGWGDI